MVSPELLSQALISGIIRGCLVAGMAAGLTLMMGVLGIFNLVYGEQIVFGGYVAFWLTHLYSVPYVASVTIAIVASLAAGYMLYEILITEMLEAPIFDQIVYTFGGLILLENLYKFIWGADVHILTSDFTQKSMDLGVIMIGQGRLVTGALGLVLIVSLYLFITRTRFGKPIYATAINERASLICGIRTEQIKRNSFLLGSAIAGVSGALLVMVQPVGPFSGLTLLITVLIAVVLGGMGSILGALIAGLLIGVLESVASLVIPGAFTPVIGFTILLLVMVLRPSGIMGVEKFGEV